jgi:hypothetical protein
MLKFNLGSKSNIDPTAIHRAFNTPKTDAVIYANALEIRELAILIATTQIKHTHFVTLPSYVSSFHIDRVSIPGGGTKYRVRNSDPAAFWVEFGAYLHHATHPQILKYKPLTRAVDGVGAGG